MFRLIYVSVRGPKYLLGNPTVHPVDAVPPDVGTRFPSCEAVQRYVRREFDQGVSCYWRVEIIDDHGAVVLRGTRDGASATGKRWIWEQVSDTH